MAANTDPIFPKSPLMAHAVVLSANTNRDGTGTIVTLVTAVTDGTKVTTIKIKATGATTAGMIRVYISDTDGINHRLFDEIPVSAIPSPSGTVASFVAIATYADLTLRSGQIVSVSTNNAETFHITASQGDY